MRHRGVLVRIFFLAEKNGEQEFTAEDEEVLVSRPGHQVPRSGHTETVLTWATPPSA